MTNGKPKVLLIGDYAEAPYHPLGAVEGRLREHLEERWEFAATEDYGQLTGDQIAGTRLCISYADRWDRPATSEQTAGLVSFVAGGGGLLVLHSGISLQARPEAAQMIGARFTGHPPYRELEFKVASPSHPVMEGIIPFTMEEEPYRFEFDPFSDHEILLTYRDDEGGDWPAAWARRFGLGRIVFLMPGHHLASFQHSGYGKLIRNAADWAGHRI
ncbi:MULTISPECIES: ThuA domain-containing protein [Paenibacillus]|uniref:ThuA domain-containing protein n=1 Tax=Paenibacillus TaxID=44249 RepID=UPI002FE2B98F